ncbi:hypothetical protein EJ419_05055 [Alloscardovia theropitheci]|uniref:Uncharacterized protein n=1 Tax=Alloscardovia theropitheci TaxID=2496842 RepID=A0A4R0QP94_9BIFI|nr:hypothetical protein [Alloscardovia theropitheci]TCD54033.1 hypothetical protein EJ419_05055 [Alloscardovia theropitheci]
MSDLRSRYTIGGAFARSLWVTAIVDVIVLFIALIAGFSYANVVGIFSVISAWVLGVCFSEINPLIAMILDKLGLKANSYLVGMLQLWGLKILFVIVLGAILLTFVPRNTAVFCLVLVFSVAIFTIKNVIISALARVL